MDASLGFELECWGYLFVLAVAFELFKLGVVCVSLTKRYDFVMINGAGERSMLV
jgi:hypothetical protein